MSLGGSQVESWVLDLFVSMFETHRLLVSES